MFCWGTKIIERRRKVGENDGGGQVWFRPGFSNRDVGPPRATVTHSPICRRGRKDRRLARVGAAAFAGGAGRAGHRKALDPPGRNRRARVGGAALRGGDGHRVGQVAGLPAARALRADGRSRGDGAVPVADEGAGRGPARRGAGNRRRRGAAGARGCSGRPRAAGAGAGAGMQATISPHPSPWRYDGDTPRTCAGGARRRAVDLGHAAHQHARPAQWWRGC